MPLTNYSKNKIKLIKTECEINGVRQEYNGCSPGDLEKAQQFYTPDKWEYIGSGTRYYINGVANNFDKPYFFFILKSK